MNILIIKQRRGYGGDGYFNRYGDEDRGNMYITYLSPYPVKKVGIPHTHTDTNLMWRFRIKMGMDSSKTYGAGFIFHP